MLSPSSENPRRRRSLALGFVCFVLVVSAARAEAAPHADPSAPWIERVQALLVANRPSEAGRAAELALRRIPDRTGALHLMLGLSRLKTGAPASALTALATAEHAAADPRTRALARFNRGVALLRLRRYASAETTLGDVADTQPALAADASLAGALAAIGLKDWTGAQARLDRAATLDHPAALDSSIASARLALERNVAAAGAAAINERRWDDARAHYRLVETLAAARDARPSERAEIESTLGYLAFRAERWSEAQAHFTSAETLRPQDGDAPFMLARLALERGDASAAADDFEVALTRTLDAATAQIAREHLSAYSFGLRAWALGLSARVETAAGYDTDAAQSTLVLDRTDGDSRGSAFASVSADLGYGVTLGAHTVALASYDFDQIAYARSALDGLSLQLHTARVTVEHEIGRWRMRLPVEGGLVLAGLRDLQAFQQTLGVRPTLAFDSSIRSSTALSFEWTGKRAAHDVYAAYAGQRFELALAQTLRLRPGTGGTLGGRVFLRREALGAPLVGTPSDPSCALACFETPLGYREIGAAFDLGWRAPWNGRIDASVTAEWRPYDGPAPRGHLAGAGFVVDEIPGRTRLDVRLAPSVAASVAVTETIDLVLRYDLVVNHSNIDNTAPGHAFDYDDKNFTKHVLALGVRADW